MFGWLYAHANSPTVQEQPVHTLINMMSSTDKTKKQTPSFTHHDGQRSGQTDDFNIVPQAQRRPSPRLPAGTENQLNMCQPYAKLASPLGASRIIIYKLPA